MNHQLSLGFKPRTFTIKGQGANYLTTIGNEIFDLKRFESTIVIFLTIPT